MSDRLGPYLLGPNDENQGIYTGDARELAKTIPDKSVDLIFTDPIYQNIDDYRWLAETAARVLKPTGHILAYCGNVQQVEATGAMLGPLQSRPTLGHFMMPPYPRLFDPMVHVNFMPLLWFSMVGARPLRWLLALQTISYHGKSWNHDWGKNATAIRHYLSVFTNAGMVCIDPFTGGGTVPAVCKMLGRRWLAFEIDPDVAERARERVRMTQPPLPGLVVEQTEMAL